MAVGRMIILVLAKHPRRQWLGVVPQAVVAMAFAGLGGVDWIGGEQAVAVNQCLVVAGLVLGAHHAPVADHVPQQALVPII